MEEYAGLFIQLGTKYVENNYTSIIKHLLFDIVSNARNTSLVNIQVIGADSSQLVLGVSMPGLLTGFYYGLLNKSSASFELHKKTVGYALV